jgi:hypothetical protein
MIITGYEGSDLNDTCSLAECLMRVSFLLEDFFLLLIRQNLVQAIVQTGLSNGIFVTKWIIPTPSFSTGCWIQIPDTIRQYDALPIWYATILSFPFFTGLT